MARSWRSAIAAAAVAVMATAAWWWLGGCGSWPVNSQPLAPLPATVKPRIVVEKSAYRLSLYDGGVLVRTYRAAIGGNPGDKEREGDRRTPDGVFYVCMKNPQSQYVLSLGLSYPDEGDAIRGLRAGLISQEQHDEIVTAIAGGCVPPWYTPLGGEIMIHGRRDGRDSTLGCVALDDDAIRQLYPVIDVGTEVEIRP